MIATAYKNELEHNFMHMYTTAFRIILVQRGAGGGIKTAVEEFFPGVGLSQIHIMLFILPIILFCNSFEFVVLLFSVC